MDGGRLGARLVWRGMLVATVLGGSVMLAGTAHAHDRSTDVLCVDQSTGEWRASMTFSAIDVRDGRPVVVTFGSASATLTEAGPNGTATLVQSFGGDQPSATLAWTIIRGGTIEQAGRQSFDQPAGCEAPPATAPPDSGPPATAPPDTPPPDSGPPAPAGPETPSTAPEAAVPELPSPGPAGPSTPAPRTAPLPATGSPTTLVVLLAAAAVVGGALIVRWTRHQPDEVIGD
jgi:hypothetical protein